MQAVQQEFRRVKRIQHKLHSQLLDAQQKLIRDTDYRLEMDKKCSQDRPMSIKQKTPKQIVTHPCNNASWMHLAHFVNDQQSANELHSIQQRFKQRQRIRDQLQMKRQEDKYNLASHKQMQNNKNREKKKVVDWGLMRSLMKQDVSQNKKRMDKIKSNQLEKIKYYHQSSYKR